MFNNIKHLNMYKQPGAKKTRLTAVGFQLWRNCKSFLFHHSWKKFCIMETGNKTGARS